MPLWTFFGLGAGRATTNWPENGDDGQDGVLGMPRVNAERCPPDCRECVEACLPGAIAIAARNGESRLELDYGRCVACQLCTEVCPTGAMTPSGDWAFGVRDRDDLRWQAAVRGSQGRALRRQIRRAFSRSLHIRHVDAGSCNGCESELQALNNPFYNLHRLGIFFTASPRHADLLLVTGTVTYAMRDALLAAYAAMPEPKWVVATGACAISGGTNGATYASGDGLEDVLPVDVYIPGCPPNPAALIQGLLLLVGRARQHVEGGRIYD